MGEGSSMGPLTPAMTKALVAQQEEGIRYPVRWTTLGGYLDHVAAMGIAPNIASFVVAGKVREMVLGDAAAEPNPAPPDAMPGVAHRAMDAVALGFTSALIYPPGTFPRHAEPYAIGGGSARAGRVCATHLRGQCARL